LTDGFAGSSVGQPALEADSRWTRGHPLRLTPDAQAHISAQPRTARSRTPFFILFHARSAYRAPAVNAFGNAHRLSCASNERNYARHIWDRRDARGCMGALATVVIPWFADRYAEGADWRAMAWWIHDHLPYSELQFFPKLAAFNIGWHERPKRRIDSFIPPRGCLTRPGMENHHNRPEEGHRLPLLSLMRPTAALTRLRSDH